MLKCINEIPLQFFCNKKIGVTIKKYLKLILNKGSKLIIELNEYKSPTTKLFLNLTNLNNCQMKIR